jgi:hypothetical protein
MKAILDSLTQQLPNILSPLLLAALTWLSWKGTSYIKAHTKNQQVQAALLRLNDAVATAVESIEQTFVSNLKPDLKADGKMCAIDSARAREKAISQIKLNLGTKGLSGVMNALEIDTSTAMEGVLEAKVEAHVLRLPNGVSTTRNQ